MRATIPRFLTSVLMISALVVVSLSVAVGDASDPLLVLPEKSFDFGYVVQGVSVSHPFVLRNGGGDSLFILRVKPG